MPIHIEKSSAYSANDAKALELIITLSNETPAPVNLVKEDFEWDGAELSAAIRLASDLGVKIIRERGCLYISLDTYPLAKEIGLRYYTDVYGSVE